MYRQSSSLKPARFFPYNLFFLLFGPENYNESTWFVSMHFKKIWSYLVCRSLNLIENTFLRLSRHISHLSWRQKAKDGKKMNTFHPADSAAESRALNLQSLCVNTRRNVASHSSISHSCYLVDASYEGRTAGHFMFYSFKTRSDFKHHSMQYNVFL